MKGNCQRCGHSFELKWLFHKSEHTIDNQLCPKCYKEWLKYCDKWDDGIEYNGEIVKAGNTKFWVAFCEDFSVKVLFT